MQVQDGLPKGMNPPRAAMPDPIKTDTVDVAGSIKRALQGISEFDSEFLEFHVIENKGEHPEIRIRLLAMPKGGEHVDNG